MKSDDVIVEASERPKVAELIREYQACSPMDGNWDQLSTNDEIRYARWPGQTADGKKNDAAYVAATQKPAFPWNGASDTRIFMADGVINEQASGLYIAFRRAMAAQKMSLGTDTARFGIALLDHWMNPLQMEDLIDQVRLSTQYWGSYGKFFLHPRWAREVQLERRVIRLEEITTLLDAAAAEGISIGGMGGEEGGEALPPVNGQEFAAMLEQSKEDKELEKICAGILQAVHGLYARQEFRDETLDLPELSPATLREAVRDLAEDGEATVPVPYVCRDELEILCLKPYEEVLVRGEVTDLKRARVFRRVFMDEVSLRRKIVEESWDADWVEAALKHKGKASTWGAGSATATRGSGVMHDPGKFAERGYSMLSVNDENTGDVEVVYAYYWALDRDSVPGVFCTVFHAEVGSTAANGDGPREESVAATAGIGKKASDGTCATHGLAEEGLIPFVLGRREVLSGHLMESRGVPQIANGWQREKKVQRDAVSDLASIGVIPPINKYSNSHDGKYRFGPAVQNTVSRGMEPKFMEVPKSGGGLAHEICDRIDAEARRYFGLMNEDVPQPVAEMRAQEQADAFLMTWTLAFAMGLRLAQVNMRDDEFARITGAPAGWLEERRQERKLFGTLLEFDVRELNPEFVLKQAEAINKVVIPGDVAGVVNRAAVTKRIFHAISPKLARDGIVSETEASQQLFDRVNADVGLMFLGNIPRLVENDPTAKTKLQYLEQILTTNPNYMGALKAGALSGGVNSQQPEGAENGGNPAVRFVQLLGVYRQNLEQSVKQEKNKEIGRVGVDTSALEGAR